MNAEANAARDAIPDHLVTLQGTELSCYGQLEWQPISVFQHELERNTQVTQQF